jgi:hypothetical protein
MRYLKWVCVLSVVQFLYACGGSSSSGTPNPPPVARFANLSTVGAIDVGSNYEASALTASVAFFSDELSGLRRVDLAGGPYSLTVSSPLVDAAVLDSFDTMYGLTLAGNIAVVSVIPGCTGLCAWSNGEIRLYDLSTSIRPNCLATLPISAEHVIAEGNLLYITGTENSIFSKLYIVDITTPASPVILSSTPISGAGYLVKKANIVYISQMPYDDASANKFQSVQTIDVSDPVHPVTENAIAGLLSFQDYAPIIMNGDTLYYLDRFGLNVVNIHDRRNPVFVTNIPLDGVSARSFSLHRNKLFVAAGSSGVKVFDITQPDNPVFLKAMRTQTAALSVTVSDGLGIYISDRLGLFRNRPSGYMMNLFYDR